ncbi:MAG: helix-turn-helix transcriptional regulator [Phyllobacteriaceae bacterium]|nr:helix-turn-helix transcriptional regulator [Phyllobacteriaceae bacterium]
MSLRWDFGLTQFRVVQALVAAVLPGTTWLVFQAAVSGRAFASSANLPHAAPPVLVGLAMFALPESIDVILIVSFILYGVLFLRLARSGDASFDQTAIEGMFAMRRAIGLLAFTLLSSATVDILVFLDFLRVGGLHAAQLIGMGNLIWLLALGVAVGLGSNGLSTSRREAEPYPNAPTHEDDCEVADAIGKLMTETPLVKDPGLNLSRIARRAGLPVRTVSNAINRVHGCNVSQYINGIRIERACDLLRKTDLSITESIYASGFQTKSNFNREFRRVTGLTPSEWRKSTTRGKAPDSGIRMFSGQRRRKGGRD